MNEPNPNSDDPFFKFIPDGHWNACIGRQGEEENYLDGYIEASIELAEAVIEKQLLGQRDTLVLPILYNARHGIELALKFTCFRLAETGTIKADTLRRNHDISAYWDALHRADIGDESLNQLIAEVRPFVDSLARIDSDGQELRYHRNRNDDASLNNYSVANLKLIRSSLRSLKTIIESLKYRTVDFVSERRTGSHTARCSRADLVVIAGLLPNRDRWNSEDFVQARNLIKERFRLGSNQFSRCLDIIQKNREMSAAIGMESSLVYLDDDTIVDIVAAWRKIHPRRHSSGRFVSGITFSIEDVIKDQEIYSSAIKQFLSLLSSDEISELEALFYFGRGSNFGEDYEERVASTRKEHQLISNPSAQLRRMLEKTNLLTCLQRAAAKVGRLRLAGQLAEM